jgi:regulatory protein
LRPQLPWREGASRLIQTVPANPAATSLRARALMWLSTREHSRQELRDKLERWVKASSLLEQTTRRAATPTGGGLDAGEAGDLAAWSPADDGASRHPDERMHDRLQDIEALLDHLTREGWLSDERFVESRVHTRSHRFGNRRIEHELKRHGVTPSTELRQSLQSSEFDRAREVWLKRFGEPPASAAERARQMRFLAARGFTAETVRKVLAAGDRDDDATE